MLEVTIIGSNLDIIILIEHVGVPCPIFERVLDSSPAGQKLQRMFQVQYDTHRQL